MLNNFNPAAALEEAGVSDFHIDYKSRIVNVTRADLAKVVYQLDGLIQNISRYFYAGWTFLGDLELKEAKGA